MLEAVRVLSSVQLAAIAELERRTVAHDGGRLKLEWGALRSRAGIHVEDLLWWQDDRLVGFLGLYAFGAPTVELAGMVDPDYRRRGIGTALLDAARPLRARYDRVLLLATPVGRPFALRHGGTLDHTEYALALAGPPTHGLSDPRITLRTASVADADVVSRLLSAGFGMEFPDLAPRLPTDPARTILIDLDGAPVGTLRVGSDGSVGTVHGFVVDPAHQGRGIGRDVLRRVCRQLRNDGVTTVGLEVAVENDRALGLYTSLGFEPVATEEYYVLTQEASTSPL